MQNMHNIHTELAVQERIHFSVSLGNQFGKDLLQMDANCTMNHEIVPKSIDRLRRAQNVSAQHKQSRICKICKIRKICQNIYMQNMHNMSEVQNITNMQNMHNMYKRCFGT